MGKSTRALAAALMAAAGLTVMVVGTSASALFAWRIDGVGQDDVLMVRAFPNAHSAILVGYPSGVRLSLTGRCTGGLRLDDIQGFAPDERQQAVQNLWCEVWLDPYADGNFRSGWVSGRFIRPL